MGNNGSIGCFGVREVQEETWLPREPVPGAQAGPQLRDMDKGSPCLVTYLTLHGCHGYIWAPQMALEIYEDNLTFI